MPPKRSRKRPRAAPAAAAANASPVPKRNEPVDLNAYANGFRDWHLKHDYAMTKGSTEVIFRDIAPKLCTVLQEFPYFVGCVAWLTEPTILDAMANKCLGMVVQKEDFLRPDLAPRQNCLFLLRAGEC